MRAIVGEGTGVSLGKGLAVGVRSLMPGTYVYVSQPLFEGALTNDATLGMKGTIVVE